MWLALWVFGHKNVYQHQKISTVETRRIAFLVYQNSNPYVTISLIWKYWRQPVLLNGCITCVHTNSQKKKKGQNNT